MGSMVKRFLSISQSKIIIIKIIIIIKLEKNMRAKENRLLKLKSNLHSNKSKGKLSFWLKRIWNYRSKEIREILKSR